MHERMRFIFSRILFEWIFILLLCYKLLSLESRIDSSIQFLNRSLKIRIDFEKQIWSCAFLTLSSLIDYLIRIRIQAEVFLFQHDTELKFPIDFLWNIFIVFGHMRNIGLNFARTAMNDNSKCMSHFMNCK